MIIVSYIVYVRKDPEAHRNSKFKLFGGQGVAFVVLAFFFFYYLYYYSLECFDTRASNLYFANLVHILILLL